MREVDLKINDAEHLKEVNRLPSYEGSGFKELTLPLLLAEIESSLV